MTKLFTLSVFILIATSLSAQKKSYLLLAYAQKNINMVCGTKVLLRDEEVKLDPAEAFAYRGKCLAQLDSQYNSKTGYKNLEVKLFPPGSAVIYYEGEQTYIQQRDQWDCTTTFYGYVSADDMPNAEKQFEHVKAEYKRCTYTNVRHWNIPATEPAKPDALQVKWVRIKTGYVAFITNTSRDMAYNVTVKTFKLQEASDATSTNFENARKLGEYKSVLQPGEKWQVKLENARAFEVESQPSATKAEVPGVIRSLKPFVRKYLQDKQGGFKPIETSNIGVRG